MKQKVPSKVNEESIKLAKGLAEAGVNNHQIAKILKVSVSTIVSIKSTGYNLESYRDWINKRSKSQREALRKRKSSTISSSPMGTPNMVFTNRDLTSVNTELKILETIHEQLVITNEYLEQLVQFTRPSIVQAPPQVRKTPWFNQK